MENFRFYLGVTVPAYALRASAGRHIVTQKCFDFAQHKLFIICVNNFRVCESIGIMFLGIATPLSCGHPLGLI